MVLDNASGVGCSERRLLGLINQLLKLMRTASIGRRNGPLGSTALDFENLNSLAPMRCLLARHVQMLDLITKLVNAWAV